jgi:hypothetical protein
VTREDRVIFESSWTSLDLRSAAAAHWLAGVVAELSDSGVFRAPPGHCKEPSPYCWSGDLDDDCVLREQVGMAHAEHLDGPRNGGIWYCSVYGQNDTPLFHTADSPDVVPRNGSAARWLCELFISAQISRVARGV